jgi:hypothetical protein
VSAFDSVDAYVEWLDDAPLPTREQRERFVDYVSHVVNWYKASPYPPGISLYLFLNKYAGWAREHGTPLVWERRVRGRNRSEIPTDEYRAAFGCLDFSNRGDRAPLVMERRTVRSQGWPDRSPGVGQLAYGLPDEILEAGMTRVTGVLHTLSGGNFWVWDAERRPSQPVWPENSGGLDTLSRIFERHRESRQLGFLAEERWTAEKSRFDVNPWKGYPSAADHEFLVDPVLHELLLPERNRQQREMIEAIHGVCDIIQRSRNRGTPRDA